MTRRVVVLGNALRGDDGAALAAAPGFPGEVLCAGRPGLGLLELLDRPTVLVDVVRTGAPPGTILRLTLAEVAAASLTSDPLSSHGFGAAEAFRLGALLGYTLPAGAFVGIEGERYTPGAALSPAVADGLAPLVAAVAEAWETLGEGG